MHTVDVGNDIKFLNINISLHYCLFFIHRLWPMWQTFPLVFKQANLNFPDECYFLLFPWIHFGWVLFSLLGFTYIPKLQYFRCCLPTNPCTGADYQQAEHTCYIHGNPLGTAGSLRASGVNKRAAAHTLRWCRRDGPSQPGGRQRGVTWFNGARPASWSLNINIVVLLCLNLWRLTLSRALSLEQSGVNLTILT